MQDRDRRPRLTYIHQHFRRPDQAGGSRPYEFASRLSQAGWDVTVICAGPEARSYDVGDVRVRQLDVPYRNDMSFPRRLVAFARFSALATLRAVGTPADVVFASSTPLSVAVPALATHAARRVPMVFEVRDLWPDVPIRLGVLEEPRRHPGGTAAGTARLPALLRSRGAVPSHVRRCSPHRTDR